MMKLGWRRPDLSLADLGLVLMLTVFLAGMATVATHLSARMGLAIFALNAASLAAGRALPCLGLPAFGALAAYVLGASLLSAAILALCVLGKMSAGSAALFAAVLALALGWRGPRHPPAGLADLRMALLVCAASGLWSWQAVIAYPRLLSGLPFGGWTDYFLHAGEIANFTNFRALQGGSIFAAGAALPLYHYGGYMLAAALCGWSGLPALAAATAFWTPLSFMLLGFGVCALGAELAGEVGGVLACIAMLLVPSAGWYGMANPFFDLHWLLQISSNSGYALAVSCLALVALRRWLRDRQPGWLAAAAGLGVLVAPFRVQLALPLCAALAMTVFFAWRPARPLHRPWHRPALAAGLLALALAALRLMENIPRAPHFFSSAHDPGHALGLMLAMQPSPSAAFYGDAARFFGGGEWAYLATVIAGLGLLALAAFGVWLPAYLGLLAWRRRAGRLAAEDLPPLAALAAYGLMILLVPNSTQEPLEFAHRPYVLVYMMLAVWAAGFLADAGRQWLPAARVLPAVLGLAVLLLLVPLRLQGSAQTSRLAWRSHLSDVTVPAGLVAVAGYLRAHAAPADVVAIPPGPRDDAFLALSERRMFSPGADFMVLQSGISAEAARRLAAAQAAMLASPDRPALGVGWIVTFPGGASAGAIYTAGGYGVIHVPPSAP